MVEIISLVEVDWSSPPTNGDYYPKMAICAWCHEDAAEDFRNGHEPRMFYQIHGGDDSGNKVCENCLKAFLKETK